jgi:hypothetical protein
MRENQTVFPHRRVVFAEAAAPIPGMGFIEMFLRAMPGVEVDKVTAGRSPAVPATLARNRRG